MVQHILSNNGYVISKKSLTKTELETLKQELTVKPQTDESYGEVPVPFPVYKEDKENIIIPRYFGTKKFGKPKNIIDTKNSNVDFEFTGKLRGTQQEVANCALDKIKSQGGGILQLHTGYGKTTLALYIASVLKLKTLIVVHKTFLQDQWYDRIKQFTTATIGMIRQKKVDIEGKDIVIGMLQSISMIDYDSAIFKDFNLVIFDEVHKCASKVFSRAFMKITPKYTIGLSATPNRADGLTKVIKWFLGDTLVKVERKGDNAVYVKGFEYKSNDKLYAEKLRWVKGKNKPDTVKMITNMYKMTDRNTFVSNIINGLRKQDERKTLVLSGRIEHLKILKGLVDDLIKKDIEEGICFDDEVKTAFYIGGMKDYELKDSSEVDIIFGTYSMAEEGLDIDGLNTLVLATPKKNIIQSIGRIMRKPIEEGDVNPLVIDILDELSCFKSWGNQRQKYYSTKKYSVNTYKSYNSDVVTYKDYMLKDGSLKKSDITPDFDMRKHYIINKFGNDTYTFESSLNFMSFPDEMFNYSCDYNDIFEINHDYSKQPKNEVKSEIDFNPVISIEI